MMWSCRETCPPTSPKLSPICRSMCEHKCHWTAKRCAWIHWHLVLWWGTHGYVIRLKRIYNFWCSMLVLHQLLHVLFTLHDIFMHFLELTY
jgi:hypothetical protein